MSESDMIIARMINAANYDLRSLELGQWFVRRLKAGVAATDFQCDPSERDIDYEAVVDALPGMNDVTKREVQDHMRTLVMEACKRGPTTAAGVAKTLNAFEQAAVGPADGVLRTMAAYKEMSQVPLPPA